MTRDWLIIGRTNYRWMRRPPGARPKKVGRPKIHPDRKAYKAEHERKRRAAAKEAKPK